MSSLRSVLRCCSKFKSSNTLVYCGLNFLHALPAVRLEFELYETNTLVYRQALISDFLKATPKSGVLKIVQR